jgi:hypothetical protein
MCVITMLVIEQFEGLCRALKVSLSSLKQNKAEAISRAETSKIQPKR